MEDVVNVSCCEKSVKTKYENQVSIKTREGSEMAPAKGMDFIIRRYVNANDNRFY